MEKIVLENPEAPELIIPGIVAYKGIETYNNIATLHDAYDVEVGVHRDVPPVNVGSLNNSSSAGTYIAHPIRSRNRAPVPVIPPLPVEPHDDLDPAIDDINLPFDDEDDFVDVPLNDTTLRNRTRNLNPTATDDQAPAEGESESGRLRFPFRLLPFAIGGGTVIASIFNPPPPDPVLHVRPLPTPTPPAILPPPTTSDPEMPLPPQPIRPESPPAPIEPIWDEQNSQTLVVVKESPFGITLPTLPAFTAGVAIGLTISSVASAFTSSPLKKRKR